MLEVRQDARVRGSLPQKDNHHEDDHSGASVVAFRLNCRCLDLGTCLRTPPCNLGAGGSLTCSPHLVGAAAAPLDGTRTPSSPSDRHGKRRDRAPGARPRTSCHDVNGRGRSNVGSVASSSVSPGWRHTTGQPGSLQCSSAVIGPCPHSNLTRALSLAAREGGSPWRSSPYY
jgi:hypothetical protein